MYHHINPKMGSNSVEWHWPLAAALLSPACPEGGALGHCETADRRTADRLGWPHAGRTSPPAARTAEIFRSPARLMGYTAQISQPYWEVVKETEYRVSWHWHAGKSGGVGKGHRKKTERRPWVRLCITNVSFFFFFSFYYLQILSLFKIKCSKKCCTSRLLKILCAMHHFISFMHKMVRWDVLIHNKPIASLSLILRIFGARSYIFSKYKEKQ